MAASMTPSRFPRDGCAASGQILLLGGGGKKPPVEVSAELEDAIRGMTFTRSRLEALTRDVLVYLCRLPEVNISTQFKVQGRVRNLNKSELITELLQKQRGTAVTVDADHLRRTGHAWRRPDGTPGGDQSSHRCKTSGSRPGMGIWARGVLHRPPAGRRSWWG